MIKLALSTRLPRIELKPLRAIISVIGLALTAYFLLYTYVWSNAHAVIDGRVYRTSQLSGRGLGEYVHAKAIRTVINLRGFCPEMDWYAEEVAITAAAGVSQEDITLSANRLPPPTELKRLIDVLDRTEYPVVLHCKQGADRTGLASAIVLLLYTNASLSRARQELWPHRGHFQVARTVAMDEFFNRYEAWLKKNNAEHTPALFRDWALNHYTPGPAVAELQWLTPLPEAIPAGKPFALTLRATNRSNDDWLFTPGTTAGLHLQYRLFNKRSEIVYDDVAGLLKRTVAPGESIDLLLAFPKLQAGSYFLRAEMADYAGAGLAVRAQYFFQFGSEAMLATLNVK